MIIIGNIYTSKESWEGLEVIHSKFHAKRMNSLGNSLQFEVGFAQNARNNNNKI